MPQCPKISSQIKHNLDKLHKNIHEGWPMKAVSASMSYYLFKNQQNIDKLHKKIHKWWPMSDISASMANYLFINKTQYWKIHKIKFITNHLWGIYMPQCPTISSQIIQNIEKYHEK